MYYISKSSISSQTYDLNVALYTDVELYLQLKEYQKKLSPEL